MRNQTVSIKMATEEQKEGIRGTVNSAIGEIFERLTHADAQAMAGAQGEVIAGVRKAFEPFILTKSAHYWLDEMKRFYQEVFFLRRDFSSVPVPVSREGFNWLLIVDRMITTEVVVGKCRERIDFLQDWDDTDPPSFDEFVVHNDRSEKDGTYAIRLRGTVEADEIHKKKSANDIQAAGIKGVTLCEQLLLMLWYHWKYGKFLDVVNITLCSGSRYSVVDEPHHYWSPGLGKGDVDWYGPVASRVGLRCREVVSIR